MEARIGRVVLIAGALSIAWIAVGPSPGALTGTAVDFLMGERVSVLGYEVQMSIQVTRPHEARSRSNLGMACLVDTGHSTVLVFGSRLSFDDDQPFSPVGLHEVGR